MIEADSNRVRSSCPPKFFFCGIMLLVSLYEPGTPIMPISSMPQSCRSSVTRLTTTMTFTSAAIRLTP